MRIQSAIRWLSLFAGAAFAQPPAAGGCAKAAPANKDSHLIALWILMNGAPSSTLARTRVLASPMPAIRRCDLNGAAAPPRWAVHGVRWGLGRASAGVLPLHNLLFCH